MFSNTLVVVAQVWKVPKNAALHFGGGGMVIRELSSKSEPGTVWEIHGKNSYPYLYPAICQLCFLVHFINLHFLPMW